MIYYTTNSYIHSEIRCPGYNSSVSLLINSSAALVSIPVNANHSCHALGRFTTTLFSGCVPVVCTGYLYGMGETAGDILEGHFSCVLLAPGQLWTTNGSWKCTWGELCCAARPWDTVGWLMNWSADIQTCAVLISKLCAYSVENKMAPLSSASDTFLILWCRGNRKMASLLHVRVGCFVSEVFFAIYILDSIVLSLMKLKGLSQPLPCFCLHLGMIT